MTRTSTHKAVTTSTSTTATIMTTSIYQTIPGSTSTPTSQSTIVAGTVYTTTATHTLATFTIFNDNGTTTAPTATTTTSTPKSTGCTSRTTANFQSFSQNGFHLPNFRIVAGVCACVTVIGLTILLSVWRGHQAKAISQCKRANKEWV